MFKTGPNFGGKIGGFFDEELCLLDLVDARFEDLSRVITGAMSGTTGASLCATTLSLPFQSEFFKNWKRPCGLSGQRFPEETHGLRRAGRLRLCRSMRGLGKSSTRVLPSVISGTYSPGPISGRSPDARGVRSSPYAHRRGSRLLSLCSSLQDSVILLFRFARRAQ